VNGKCDGGLYGCGNPATFVFRNEDTMPGSQWTYRDRIGDRELPVTVHACGKHLAALIAAFPIPTADSTRFLVVPCNPNIELIPNEGTDE